MCWYDAPGRKVKCTSIFSSELITTFLFETMPLTIMFVRSVLLNKSSQFVWGLWLFPCKGRSKRGRNFWIHSRFRMLELLQTLSSILHLSLLFPSWNEETFIVQRDASVMETRRQGLAVAAFRVGDLSEYSVLSLAKHSLFRPLIGRGRCMNIILILI